MKTWHVLAVACGIAVAGIAIGQTQTAPGLVTGCQYLASAITLTNLQTSPLLCDINGRLKVTTTP